MTIQQRTDSIKNIPRLTFVLPQNTSSVNSQQNSPIFLCQSGCQLEFNFKNISNASIYNDGNLFSITPLNDNKQNYIKWNGSNTNGQDMTTFYLKEIFFQAPAKDVVGSISYNKSIQYYLTFINEEHSNLMIVISVIGQANNIGNQPQTNGFTLLNTLANQIPLRGDEVQLSNLKNLNLGTLLPESKSFFSTLTNNNNVQYISMKTIVDVPLSFFNNMVSRVVGGTNAYKQRVNNYIQNTPVNPPGTFIFYNENIPAIGAGEAFVCNSNCQQVPGKESQLSPTIGSRTTRQVEPQQRDDSHIRNVELQAVTALEEEECEMEEVWPGQTTDINVVDKDNLEEEDVKQSGYIIVIVFMVLVMVVGFIGIFVSLKMKFNLLAFKDIFSSYFWNRENAKWIAFGLFGIITLCACIITWIVLYSEQQKPENKDKDYKSWISLIIGGVIYTIVLVIILYKSKKIFSSQQDMQQLWQGKDIGAFPSQQMYSPFSGDALPTGFQSQYPNLSSKITSPFSGRVPTAPPLSQLNMNTPNYKFTNAVSQLNNNPSLINTPQGKQLYKNAMNSYKKLPASQRNLFKQSFGNQLFNPSSEFSKGVMQPGQVDPAVSSALSSNFQKYKTLSYITPQMQKEIMQLAQSNPSNQTLGQLSQMIAPLTNGGIMTPQALELLIKFASNPNLP